MNTSPRRPPDELAGVLAHELGHVAHRDGLRRLIRDGGTGFLGALLERITGDEDSAVPSLLRDHPLTPERVARLAAANAAPDGPDLLDPAEWRALQAICR